MPANDDDTLLPFSLPSLCGKKITAAFDGGTISSDGGVILLAGADKTSCPFPARHCGLPTPVHTFFCFDPIGAVRK